MRMQPAIVLLATNQIKLYIFILNLFVIGGFSYIFYCCSFLAILANGRFPLVPCFLWRGKPLVGHELVI